MKNKIVAMQTEKTGFINRPLRVVIVDDEAMIRNSSRAILEGYGYCVLNTFEDGSQALEALKTVANDKRPDIILSDVNMPNMNGKELKVALRSLGIATKMVFMTGYSDDIFSEEERQLTLSKPFNIKELLTKLYDEMPHRVPDKVREKFPELENKMLEEASTSEWGYLGVNDSKLLGIVRHDLNNVLQALVMITLISGNREKDQVFINHIMDAAKTIRLIRKGIEGAFVAYHNGENINPANLYVRRNREDDAKKIGEAICEIDSSILLMPGKNLSEYRDRLVSFIKYVETLIKAIVGQLEMLEDGEDLQEINNQKKEAEEQFNKIIFRMKHLSNHN